MERRRTNIVALSVLLVIANLGAWAWALVAFRGYPLLLGTALLAYGLGLRHAIDADHIAAIDNVTRKLMHDGQRPIGVGFFFSLGHSTVVVLASVLIAATAAALETRLAECRVVGSAIGTLVSATFLLGIAAMNCVILASIYRAFRRVRAGGAYVIDSRATTRSIASRNQPPDARVARRVLHQFAVAFTAPCARWDSTDESRSNAWEFTAIREKPVSDFHGFSPIFTYSPTGRGGMPRTSRSS